MKSIFLLTITLLIIGCSSHKITVQKKSIKPEEDPLSFIKDHNDLKKPLLMNISINYPAMAGLTKDEAKEARETIFKNAVSQSLSTIYLLPSAGLVKNTSKVEIISDETGRGCKDFLVQEDLLVCSDEKSQKSWNQDKSISLRQYYWEQRYGDEYLKVCSNKPGVYLDYKETAPFEFTASQIQDDGYEINLQYTDGPDSDNKFYERFGLNPLTYKIIVHKQDNAELSLEYFLMAQKKSGQLSAPVSQLSEEFDNYVFYNAIFPSKPELQEAQNKILDLFQSFEFKRFQGNTENLKSFYEGCPMDQKECGIKVGSFYTDLSSEEYVIPQMSNIDLTNKNQMRRLVKDNSYRTHIMGLLMLAHTTYEMERPSKDKVILKFKIDMNSLLSKYSTKPIKELIE